VRRRTTPNDAECTAIERDRSAHLHPEWGGVASSGPSDELSAAVRTGFGEDRVQVVLHGVRGEEHFCSDSARVDAGREPSDEFGLAPCEAGGATEQINTFRRSRRLDRHGDAVVDTASAQRHPRTIAEMDS
jgi:hypothetical protein